MTHKQLAGAFALATTLLATGSAFAAGPTNAEYYPFQEVTSATTPRADVVSGANLTTNVRTMGANADTATIDQSRQILMYLKAGA